MKKAGNLNMTAEELTKLGYRRISNKHRIVARIDRADWLEVMAADTFRSVADFYRTSTCGKAVVGREPEPGWYDHYRRCYSKDKLEGVPDAVFKAIPGSDWDRCGYVAPNPVGAVMQRPLVVADIIAHGSKFPVQPDAVLSDGIMIDWKTAYSGTKFLER